jgi:hypothetical protein
MAELVLTVRVPQIVTTLHGRGRVRAYSGEALVPMASPTRVFALRRTTHKGIVSDTVLEADAFIPEHYRGQIGGHRSAWLTPEIRRCFVFVEDNRKSLRPFLESGDAEWTGEQLA